MKIECACGHLIIDQADSLKHKGYIISDTQWFDFWDALDHAIEKSGPSALAKERACMQLRKMDIFKTIWECTHCGKLYINGPENELIAYSPDSNQYQGILDRKV